MSSKSERKAAWETVGKYHEEQLGELLGHVGEAVDRFRAGDLDAFDVDRVLFQYSRAAKELWKFCNLGQVEFTASLIRGELGENFGLRNDWWESGRPRER
ncbi:MAG: hypothetical protein GX555_04870 [Actinomycetales bacterium]|nr:hypothetical protein [Actinomycetales bacterium]